MFPWCTSHPSGGAPHVALEHQQEVTATPPERSTRNHPQREAKAIRANASRVSDSRDTRRRAGSAPALLGSVFIPTTFHHIKSRRRDRPDPDKVTDGCAAGGAARSTAARAAISQPRIRAANRASRMTTGRDRVINSHRASLPTRTDAQPARHTPTADGASTLPVRAFVSRRRVPPDRLAGVVLQGE
ncbi:hypothetical protein EVAR_41876_1 [Eumeta japonica]|uniref:Uncharacterized protein n=1 Tax=Eumeta variegata TaxID=151549 RepID=A0A4C1XCL3_EUMVA|nr:hypothetical protein EVAR_41876_1 [Eumeta japonica]